jgi:hypothetical protein
VTGVGVDGVGGGAGEAGRESRLRSEYILEIVCRRVSPSLEASSNSRLISFVLGKPVHVGRCLLKQNLVGIEIASPQIAHSIYPK